MSKNNIASERVRLGLSRTRLSEILDIQPRTLCNYETGVTPPSATLIVQLADMFDCSLDYLMGRVDDRHASVPAKKTKH